MSNEKQDCCGKLGKWTVIAVVLVLALGVLSWATMEQRKSIAQTLGEMDECSTFVSCVEKAGMDGVLEKDGPFTVFVPTNEAFKQVKADSLNKLLENKSALTTLILYHMIPKNLTSAEMENLGDCMTCTVPQTAINCDQNHFGKGKCVKSEIPCANGLIYLIDAVQFPPFLTNPDVIEEEVTVVETVTDNGNDNAGPTTEAKAEEKKPIEPKNEEAKGEVNKATEPKGEETEKAKAESPEEKKTEEKPTEGNIL